MQSVCLINLRSLGNVNAKPALRQQRSILTIIAAQSLNAAMDTNGESACVNKLCARSLGVGYASRLDAWNRRSWPIISNPKARAGPMIGATRRDFAGHVIKKRGEWNHMYCFDALLTDLSMSRWERWEHPWLILGLIVSGALILTLISFIWNRIEAKIGSEKGKSEGGGRKKSKG